MSGGDYKYVNPPKLGIPSWGELLDKGSNSIILGEIGENLEPFFIYPLTNLLEAKPISYSLDGLFTWLRRDK